ncbi:MAG: hypothetical protein O7D96_08275, partial [SAR324 cluster bacterium]|nr:hypothetical protein [SAR324 cluster bacterium]
MCRGAARLDALATGLVHFAIEEIPPQFPHRPRGQAMEPRGPKRKLAAILMADVVEYGRLMGA